MSVMSVDRMDVEKKMTGLSQKVSAMTQSIFRQRASSAPTATSTKESDTPILGIQHKVKVALSLYKVQQSIYLLDFQRIEVSTNKLITYQTISVTTTNG